MESILISIKKLLGIPKEYEHFDPDIVMHINSVFDTLTQIGVGPADGFRIEDEDITWSDFIQDKKAIESVKSYMYLRVRLLFDPPLNSAVLNSMNNQINELTWRLNVEADKSNRFVVTSDSDGIILTDRKTNVDYELYVEDSRLMIVEESED